MKIEVFFNSGNKAKFEINDVRFVSQYPGKESFTDGKTVVNWENVSFVREEKKPKEEDEE